jgi:hypothetical protein
MDRPVRRIFTGARYKNTQRGESDQLHRMLSLVRSILRLSPETKKGAIVRPVE